MAAAAITREIDELLRLPRIITNYPILMELNTIFTAAAQGIDIWSSACTWARAVSHISVITSRSPPPPPPPPPRRNCLRGKRWTLPSLTHFRGALSLVIARPRVISSRNASADDKCVRQYMQVVTSCQLLAVKLSLTQSASVYRLYRYKWRATKR